MTALTQDRKTDQLNTPDSPMPTVLNFPVEAATTIFGGALVATNAAGNAVPASATSAQKLWGRCKRQVVNTTAAGFGAAGALQVTVDAGVFYFNNGAGGDAIAAANVGQYCYAADDNTVTLTDGGGTRPLAGVIFGVGEYGLSPTGVGQIAVGVGFSSPYATNPLLSSNTRFRARNVVTTNVATPTGAGAYTVASASTNDNVLNVAGDVIILSAQTTPAQNGPWVVGAVATGTAALTRPDWWASGSSQLTGQQIRVGGEGSVFKNTLWHAMHASDSVVIDTTDPQFFPLEVSGQSTLVAGTFTIATVPIFSTKSNVSLVRTTANTSTATTGGYQPTVAGATGITAGVVGTGAVIVQACIAAGTINNADVSTLNWTIKNQP